MTKTYSIKEHLQAVVTSVGSRLHGEIHAAGEYVRTSSWDIRTGKNFNHKEWDLLDYEKPPEEKAPEKAASQTISLDKKYRTRGSLGEPEGREVQLYNIVSDSFQPVHGAIRQPSGHWNVSQWNRDGSYYAERADGASDTSCNDLIEAKPTITRWVNFYGADMAAAHPTKQSADSMADARSRIACVKVTFQEGDGLGKE